MRYGHVVRVILILFIWALATIVALGWSAVLLRHIKSYNTEEVILSETIHTLLITLVLVALIFVCLFHYPETLNTIVTFSEGITGTKGS